MDKIDNEIKEILDGPLPDEAIFSIQLKLIYLQ